MEFAWTAEQHRLRDEARALAATAVATYGRANDPWLLGYRKEFAKELAAHRWIGMTWPVEYGGAGRPPIDRLIVAEEMIAAGAPVASVWLADRQIGPVLIAYGTPEQRARWIPSILAGEVTWCIGMSEPDAGSDLAGIATRARRDGDEWVINGRKIWTSFANVADYCYLICRTGPPGRGHSGISEIVVPMGIEGVHVETIRDLVGNRHFCEVAFTDVRVPAENLVGTEGAAFKQTMRQLEHERGGIDRLLSNVALFRHARERADTSDPLIRQEIALLESSYRIGRLMVYREALQQGPRGFSAATKCFCTEHEQRVARFASRVLGAWGTLWDEEVSGTCYAPAYTIMGGTSNVLRNAVAERLLGLPKDPAAPVAH